MRTSSRHLALLAVSLFGCDPAAPKTTSPSANASSASAPTKLSKADECQLIQKFEAAHFGDEPTWFNWLAKRKQIERTTPWCDSRTEADKSIIDDLANLRPKLHHDAHLAWAKTAAGHLDDRFELLGKLCQSFATPVETAAEKVAREERISKLSFIVEGSDQPPPFRKEESALIHKLQETDGKMGFVMPTLTVCKDT